MAEHIQHQQIEEQKKLEAEQEYKKQQQQIKQNHEQFSKQQQFSAEQQKQNQSEKSPIKRKISGIKNQHLNYMHSIPQIRIIVSSPPKEVQTEPYLAMDDHIKLDDYTVNHNSSNNKNISSNQIQSLSCIDDDEDVPEENTENIIESTLFKFNQLLQILIIKKIYLF